MVRRTSRTRRPSNAFRQLPRGSPSSCRDATRS
jgi:hypothetical protein